MPARPREIGGRSPTGFFGFLSGFGVWFPGATRLSLTYFRPSRPRALGDTMEWTAPAFEEVCLNCEINSYASAKL